MRPDRAGLRAGRGVKAYASSAGHACILFLLFDEEGKLAVVMEADRLGQLRTGAAPGVATDVLARLAGRDHAL